jgi:hypothetical protein
MKTRLVSIALAACALFGIVSAAAADPVVEFGSSYSVYVEGEASDHAFSAIGPFNGVPKEFTRSGLILSLTESDTDLGAGMNHIAIDLRANGDLFTTLGEQGFLGVGTDGDGLNLLSLVSLDEAYIRLFDLDGTLLFASANLANTADVGKPWNGFFPGENAAIGLTNLGGMGVSHVMFDFQVSQLGATVPEPGGLMLIGVALIGLGASRRRKTGR